VVSALLTLLLAGVILEDSEILDMLSVPLVLGLLIALCLLIAHISLPHTHWFRTASLVTACVVVLSGGVWLVIITPVFDLVASMALSFLVCSFLCDVVFIATTRRMLRWAGEMTRTPKVVGVLGLNLALAIALIFPLLFPSALSSAIPYGHSDAWGGIWFFIDPFIAAIAASNLFNCLFAILFVILAAVLLVHRAIWPLLTRTLFRMTDIGTKGRRAILTAVGLALLSASVFGDKAPDLFKDLMKIFGG
jgi:hypothetical protein